MSTLSIINNINNTDALLRNHAGWTFIKNMTRMSTQKIYNKE